MQHRDVKRAKFFNIFILGGVTLVAGVVLAVNIAMDPWGLMYNPNNHTQGASPNFQGVNERITHAYWMRQNTFDVLHVGSSRVRYMLDKGIDGIISSAQSKTVYPDKTVYSAGISGTNMHIMRRVTEHALALQDLSQAILLIDFVSMNDARPDGAGWKDERYEGGRISESKIAILSNYLSFNMFSTSLENMFPDIFANKDESSIANIIKMPEPRSQKDKEEQWKLLTSEFFRYDLYGCYSLSQRAIEDIDVTLAQLKGRDVDVKILFPPIHYTLYEMIWRTGNWENYKNFVRSVVKIAAKYDVPTWHSSPYTPFTDMDILKYDYAVDKEFDLQPNYYDPGHANQIISLELLKIAQGIPTERTDIPSNFATQLTPKNIELELTKLSEQRTSFLSRSLKFLYLVPAKAEKPGCSTPQ